MAGEVGGTLNLIHRLVKDENIAALQLHRLRADWDKPVMMGDFTSVWHEAHSPMS